MNAMALPERRLELNPADLRSAAAVMLGAGALLPILPGHPGLACPLRRLTGIPCPLCGMTTSVEDTVRLHFHAGLAANPGGLLAVVVAIGLLLLRPRRLVVPAVFPPLVLLAMWVFELHRFSVL
jgi:hypothetical protein